MFQLVEVFNTKSHVKLYPIMPKKWMCILFRVVMIGCMNVYRCNWTLFVILNATFIGNASGFQWQQYVNWSFSKTASN